MAVFLSFGNCKLSHFVRNKQFGKSILDFWRVNKIVFRDLKVSVILKHARIGNIGLCSSVKFIKIVIIKSHAELKRSVATEIKENYAVAVFDSAHRLAVFGNNKGRQILIDNSRYLGTVGFNGFLCRSKLPALALDMGFPAELNHIPIRLIAVHGDFHSATARSNSCIKRAVRKLGKLSFKLLNIDKSGGCGNISAVKQNVNSCGLYAAFLCLFEHCKKMRNV